MRNLTVRTANVKHRGLTADPDKSGPGNDEAADSREAKITGMLRTKKVLMARGFARCALS